MCLDIASCPGVMTCLSSTPAVHVLAPRRVSPGPRANSRVMLQHRASSGSVGTSGHVLPAGFCLTLQEEV